MSDIELCQGCTGARALCPRCEGTGIGRLSNRIVAAPAPRATVGHLPTASSEVRRVSLGNDERLPDVLRQSPASAK